MLMTDAIACSEVLSAAPASYFALCSSGRRSMSCWNWFLPFCPFGASRDWMSLKAERMCRSGGGQNSTTSNIVAASSPSAAS